MKVINLDKFKKHQVVELEGQQYKVRGISVGEYLDDKVKARLDAAGDDAKAVIREMISLLTELTDIPEEVLLNQGTDVLKAIIVVAQGGDPDEDEASEDSEKK